MSQNISDHTRDEFQATNHHHQIFDKEILTRYNQHRNFNTNHMLIRRNSSEYNNCTLQKNDRYKRKIKFQIASNPREKTSARSTMQTGFTPRTHQGNPLCRTKREPRQPRGRRTQGIAKTQSDEGTQHVLRTVRHNFLNWTSPPDRPLHNPL